MPSESHQTSRTSPCWSSTMHNFLTEWIQVSSLAWGQCVLLCLPCIMPGCLVGPVLSTAGGCSLQSALAERVLPSSFWPPRICWPDRRAWLNPCSLSADAYMDVDPVTILRYIEKHPAESRKLLSRVGDEDVDSIAVLITHTVQATLERQAGPQQKVP